ncbi:Regulatory protein TetR [uncultured Mycobacterium sp.]|uniref:Regulatory protein TetR n=1 Tax=uncultured Mycobacterium sp. TaxID=171292 RepID=A0A1Y5PP57_9MYCO|nr:Regulatory protein TetR [uncultured Mycobacterium sp.]
MSAGLAPARPSKRAVGRPRGSNTDARREMIISAAVRVFAYRGYDAATLQEVAELVDITRPAVHHYFPGKAPLYRAALDRAHDIVMAPAPEHTLARFTAPPHGESRLACALLGTSLAQSHRIAEVAPRITSVSADLRRLCEEALGAKDEQRADLLVAMIVGRWVLTACDLTWLDIETGFGPL